MTERLTFTSYLVAIPVGIFQIALFFGLIAATIIKLVQHFLSTSELVAGFQERRAYHREIRENQRQVQEERKLDDLDRQFQEDNPQLTDTDLRKRYQLDETIDSLNLEPTYELNELIKQIGPRDADYSWIVLDNAQYFPPKMLHDFPRLVKIHQILIDGGASNWAGALQALKADEANKRIFAQFNQLHDEVEESSIIASQAIQATQEQLEKAIDSVSANVTEYSKEVDQFASDAERARAALAGAISSLESRAARDPFMRY
ncbi:hypothetical protein [Lacticaseibacillus daqingensis]|uniref:hypothetical protein n=1 Tax=Lacticaseibacillus daqingensis TaxID=2486014 RepID=UPI0013DE2B93|nr:hypothetical protein [Lacticaseibacillus daqingensis]